MVLYVICIVFCFYLNNNSCIFNLIIMTCMFCRFTKSSGPLVRLTREITFSTLHVTTARLTHFSLVEFQTIDNELASSCFIIIVYPKITGNIFILLLSCQLFSPS